MSPGIRPSELLHVRVERFSRALRGLETGDVKALHRARVATRRLREILPVLCIDPVTGRKLIRRLRRTTARLGTVRELDVVLLLIDELHESRREHAPALGRIAIAVAKARDDERRRLFSRLPVRELRTLAGKLDDIVKELNVEADAPAKTLRSAIDARVARRAQRLKVAMRDAGSVYLPERLHVVRIAVKKLRYSAELASQITAADLTPEVRTLRTAQDILGRMHDVEVLIDRVRQVQATLAPPSINVWRALEALQRSLDDDCRRLHARYLRARPKLEVVADRLGAIAPAAAVASAAAKTRATRAG